MTLYTFIFQAIYTKIKSEKLNPYLKANSKAKILVKKILCLAFLPDDIIETEYKRLCKVTDKRIIATLRPFLTYYENQWIKRVKPQGFSISGLYVRSNNAIEANNSQLGHRLEPHPMPWVLICMLT